MDTISFVLDIGEKISGKCQNVMVNTHRSKVVALYVEGIRERLKNENCDLVLQVKYSLFNSTFLIRVSNKMII